jgi:hypothetical protein
MKEDGDVRCLRVTGDQFYRIAARFTYVNDFGNKCVAVGMPEELSGRFERLHKSVERPKHIIRTGYIGIKNDSKSLQEIIDKFATTLERYLDAKYAGQVEEMMVYRDILNTLEWLDPGLRETRYHLENEYIKKRNQEKAINDVIHDRMTEG